MNDTPETDEAVKASNGQWSFVLKETCQRLERERDEAIRQRDETNTSSKYACDYNYEQKLKAERERDEAREDLEFRRGLYKVQEEYLETARRERDKAREDATNYYARIGELESERDGLLKKLKSSEKECVKQGKDIEMLELALKAVREERNEAREKAERYRLEANAMMLQRDELKKIVEQRILVGAEIHDKANSLLKQSNRTEAECEALRKQLTAATSALRQIHLEVGDWIRSTIIVEE